MFPDMQDLPMVKGWKQEMHTILSLDLENPYKLKHYGREIKVLEQLWQPGNHRSIFTYK